jgi:hypothetical protein
MFLPMTALITVVNLLAGRLTTRSDPRLPMILGQVVLVAGVCGLLALGPDTPLLMQAAVLLPIGIGWGLAVPALTAALLESVDADRAELAGGLLDTGRQFGGALGVAPVRHPRRRLRRHRAAPWARWSARACSWRRRSRPPCSSARRDRLRRALLGPRAGRLPGHRRPRVRPAGDP